MLNSNLFQEAYEQKLEFHVLPSEFDEREKQGLFYEHKDSIFKESQNTVKVEEKVKEQFESFQNEVKFEDVLEFEVKQEECYRNKTVENHETETTSKRSKNSSPGLKQWARKTFGLIQKHQELSLIELDNFLSNHQNFGHHSEKSKNRKRRIYDAINVAISQGFLKKEKRNKKNYIKKTKTKVIGNVSKEMVERKRKQLGQYELIHFKLRKCFSNDL